MNKKILLTGGAGFIGSHAVRHFLQQGYQVVVFDNFSRGFHQALEVLANLGDLQVIEGDLQDSSLISRVLSEGNFAGVLHFAALCLVSESMSVPELYFANNVLGSFNLLEACRQAGVKKFIFSSTCAVYGEANYLPLDENHPKYPTNPYGTSKLMVEEMLEWYGKIHGFSYAILRYFNVCGSSSDGLIGDSKKPSQLLMQNAVRGAMQLDSFSYTCPEVATPDKTPIRDYIDVEDLVAAHYLAYRRLETDDNFREAINLSNGVGYSVKQIVQAVEKDFGVEIAKCTPAQLRQGEYPAVYALPKKAQQLLGWQTQKTLEQSIASLRLWYQHHPHGWDY